MSRSYRKPYASVCHHHSLKEDRRLANRAVRRSQNRVTRMMACNEDLLMPHHLECAWNDVWCWSSDGKTHWAVPGARLWSRHCEAVYGIGYYSDYWSKSKVWKEYREKALVWPPTWFIKLMRK